MVQSDNNNQQLLYFILTKNFNSSKNRDTRTKKKEVGKHFHFYCIYLLVPSSSCLTCISKLVDDALSSFTKHCILSDANCCDVWCDVNCDVICDGWCDASWGVWSDAKFCDWCDIWCDDWCDVSCDDWCDVICDVLSELEEEAATRLLTGGVSKETGLTGWCPWTNADEPEKKNRNETT
jgi:hypothetical protein